MPSKRSFSEGLKLWAVAVRAYAYPASVVPILLGSVYAWYAAGSFLWGRFLLALAAGMLYHTGCNLINDYCDYRRGVDRIGADGGSGVLVGGKMSPREIATGAAVCLAAGTLIGAYFVYLCGWEILVIGAAGLLGAVFYTASPWSAKYNALGEPLVFLMMGVGMVLGSYCVQTGTLSGSAVWVSLPVGFLVAAILQANDTRDIADDRESGIRTLAILLGPDGARWLYSALLFAPYVTLCALVAVRVLPRPALIATLSFPAALRLHALFWRVRDLKDARLVFMPHRTAALHLAFGLLMCAGIALSRWA